ncbi:MAG: hypothetical protein AAFR36_09375 [Bacteroidota bacterium]
MTEPVLRIEDVLETSIYQLDCAISHSDADQLVELLRTKQKRLLDEKEIRNRLHQWHAQRKMRDRRLNFKKVAISSSIFLAVRIVVKQLTEERKVKKVELPYRAQNLPAYSILEGVWDKPTSTQFSREDQSWVREGSHRIEDCHTCNQRGKVRCHHCHGSGRDKKSCSRCGGSGRITELKHRHGQGAPKHERVRCSKCNGQGRIDIRCNRCNGRGEVTCGKCDGETRLFAYEEIQAQTRVDTNEKVTSPAENLKANWLSGATPNTRLEKITFNDAPITEGAEVVDTGKHYELEVFDVHQLTFFYKKEDREVFIVGDKVLPVDGSYLYDWRSIIYLLIGFLALAGMVYLLFTLYNG